MTKPLLKWTGHPLADVGVATLCAMAGKDDPEQLTLEDLDRAGEELKAAYTDSVFVAYLSCVFPNSAYVNPTMKRESRERAMQRLLFPHRAPADEGIQGTYCVFSNEPATHLLERSQMPMLTGAGVMNFFPAGFSEMAVAAPYLLAIQALPLGGRRSEGKLLIVHCDDPTYTLQFAGKYLAKNRSIIDLSRRGELPAIDDPQNQLKTELPGGLNKEKRPKYPDAKDSESLVMSDLVDVVKDRYDGRMRLSETSVTVYLLSNSGQGPSLAMLHIPSEFLRFLFDLHGAAFSSKWQRLVSRAWRAGKGGSGESDTDSSQDAPSKKGKKKESKPAPRGPGRSRNDLYNDLFAIFENGYSDWLAATRFIRRHLLSDATKYFFNTEKNPHHPPRINFEHLDLIDWELTTYFLEKVLGMNKERLDAIRAFADKLANVIDSEGVNGGKLFRELAFVSKESPYRSLLARLQVKTARTSGTPAFSFNDYVTIFLTPESDEKVYWSMIRDIITIALVESLHKRNFFSRIDIDDASNDEPTEDDSIIENVFSS